MSMLGLLPVLVASHRSVDVEVVDEILDLIYENAGTDGAHHKQWLLDQIVRVATGSDEEYKNWVRRYNNPPGSTEEYEWDVGITP